VKNHWYLVGACVLAGAAFGCSDVLEGGAAKGLMMAVASTQSNFRASHSIGTMAEPADLKLYRELLPRQFDMPQHPMVSVNIVDNSEVGPWPLTPYQLGSISLRCSYRGEEGWHPITMPESKWIPVWAGRAMGFPKYVADEVSLVQSGGSWRGEVVHDGRSRILLEFTPEPIEPPIWIEEGWSVGGPTFNLRPPSEGPQVEVVRSVAEENAEPTSEKIEGTIRVTLGPDEPGAGLLEPGAPSYGIYSAARDMGRSLQTDD
jgi:hypothetical protein